MPRAMLPQTMFSPISPILRDRRFTLALVGAAGVQIALASLSLPGWECPFFRVTGIPCPGCGLTRAVMLLIHGDVRASLRFHAFAPILLLFILVLVLAALLPEKLIQPIISRTEQVEGQTKFTLIILSGLILYWLARLLFLNSSFVQLIRG